MIDYKERPILFLGTASFAVGFLEDLVKEGYNVAAVVTGVDKPQGRGRKLAPSPVKECALKYNLPLLQPHKLSDEKFIQILQNIKPYLGVVVAFRMLPKAVWSLPTLGTINLHGSLLPRWRGAAPINHALMAGDKETGVTLFRLKQELDEGDIIAKASLSIPLDETFETLHQRLNTLGRELFRSHLPKILKEEGSFTKQPFGVNEPYAGKLTTDNTRIDWERSALEIHNFIRGLSPYPSAWTTLFEGNEDEKNKNNRYKIILSELDTSLKDNTLPAGSILFPHKGMMQVVAGDGCLLNILALQAPGKKILPIKEYLNGAKFPPKARFI